MCGRMDMTSALTDQETPLYPEPDESNPQLTTLVSLRFILILFVHLRLDLPSVSSLHFSDQKFVLIYYSSHACYMPRQSPH